LTGSDDVYVLKLNADGVIQWSKIIGGSNADWGTSIINTLDGGFAIGGFTASFGAGGGDFYMIKMDANGNLQWTKTIGGDDTDMAFSITQASDGGYALAGYTFSYGQSKKIFTSLNLNGAGILQWTKNYWRTQY
ncbi:MAG: hypothetical protein IPG39_11775, partial [Bacteroidetes bacterium]|nr:hypothetical protein [Bacteroidota bacterium]